MATLTGNAATEALQLYTRLGGSGATFDAGKVARAVRSTQGRIRVRLDLFRSVVVRRPAPVMVRMPKHDRVTRRVIVKAQQRNRYAGDAPGRPRPAPSLWCDWRWS